MGSKLSRFRKIGYEKYMAEAEFREWVKDMFDVATHRRICIMGLEVSSEGCHKGYIARHLVGYVFEVRHIISDKKVVDGARVV